MASKGEEFRKEMEKPEPKPVFISKSVRQEYENGELVLNDGGLGKERAEKELKEIEDKVKEKIGEAMERAAWEAKRRN
jgi:hypothetical protein